MIDHSQLKKGRKRCEPHETCHVRADFDVLGDAIEFANNQTVRLVVDQDYRLTRFCIELDDGLYSVIITATRRIEG